MVDSAIAGGAGILHASGDLTLRRVSVVGNTVSGTSGIGAYAAGTGGGINSAGGLLALYDSNVRDNAVSLAGPGTQGAYGGGIYRQGVTKLVRTSVSENRVAYESSQSQGNAVGGGIYTGGNLTLLSARITGNRAIANGSGVGTATAWGAGVQLNFTPRFVMRNSTVGWNRAVAAAAGGLTDARGGGLHGDAPEAKVVGSRIVGNSLRSVQTAGGNAFSFGGGLALTSADFTLLRSRVTRSTVLAEGGGEATAQGGGLGLPLDTGIIGRTRIDQNQVRALDVDADGFAAGGGIWAAESDLTVVNSTLDANRARGGGNTLGRAQGGGAEVSGRLTLRSSTASRNVATSGALSRGGGIRLDGTTPSWFVNSTLVRNRAAGLISEGGAISTAAELAITHSTVARNTATSGGGIHAEDRTTTLKATIVAANPGQNCNGATFASTGWNLFGDPTGCPLTPTDQQNVSDPRLGQLAWNGGPTQTLRLLAGSPALNWIPGALCATAEDQRGVRRPQSGKCDVGAFERRPGGKP